MRWFTAVFLGLLLWGQSGLSSAGDAVRAFASELMLHESKQILQPDRVVKYSDPEGGATLRALLAPARTAVVLDDYFAEFVKGTAQPDVSRLAGPLVKRYEKAFAADPRAYEEEYLDSLNWTVSTLEGSARVAAGNMKKNTAAPGADAEAVRKVVESLQSLSDSVMKMVAQAIRDKVNSGVFSAAGKERASSMADRVLATLRPAPPVGSQSIPPVRAAAVNAQDIEDRFARSSLLNADAFAQVQKCEARFSRKSYDDLMAAASRGQSGVTYLNHSGSAVMVVAAGQYWTCLKLGPTGNPALPVEVLRNTVTTIGASGAGLATWRRKLLAELAMTGKAEGLIETANGSASIASFTLSRANGISISYDVRHVKAGAFNRADYNIVISEPGITSVALIYAGNIKARGNVELFAPLAREPLAADGYVPIPGSVMTAATDFSGSVWKAESLGTHANMLRLEPQGVAVFQSAMSPQTGQWKVSGNVLQVAIGPDARYSLALSADGRFLEGELVRNEVARPVIRGMSAIPRHDDAEGELRFKVPRFYRPSDADYEAVVAAKRENARLSSAQSVRNLFMQAELRKAQILAETPEKEAEEQAKAPANPYTWRACDDTLLSQLMSANMPTPAPEFAGRSVGEVCYAWMGTRRDWKTTILQEGCRGRCSRF